MANNNGNGQITIKADPDAVMPALLAMATPATLPQAEEGIYGPPGQLTPAQQAAVGPMPAPTRQDWHSLGSALPPIPTDVQGPPVPQAASPATPAVAAALPPIAAAPAAGSTAPTGALGTIPGTAPAGPAPPPQPQMSPQQQADLQTLPFTRPGAPAGGPAPAMTTPMPTPPPIPRRGFWGTLGQVAGTALGAVAPGVAAQIPGTPLGRIAAQQRGFAQQKLAAEVYKTQAEVERARAETAKAQAEALGEWRPTDLGTLVQTRSGQQVSIIGADPRMLDRLLPDDDRPYRGDVPATNKMFADQYYGSMAPDDPRRSQPVPAEMQMPTANPSWGDYKTRSEALTRTINESGTAEARRNNEINRQHALAIEQQNADIRRQEEEAKDQEPVVYFDKNGQRILDSRMAARQAGGKIIGRTMSPTEVDKETSITAQLNDVQLNLSRYQAAVDALGGKLPQDQIDAMTKIIAIDKALEGPVGNESITGQISAGQIPIAASQAQQSEMGAAWNYLAQKNPAGEAMMRGYFRMRGALLAYQRVISGSARQSQLGLQFEAPNVPEPYVGVGVASRRLKDFQENMDTVAKQVTRIPGMDIPSDIRDRFTGQRPQAQGGGAAAAAGAKETPVTRNGKIIGYTQDGTHISRLP